MIPARVLEALMMRAAARARRQPPGANRKKICSSEVYGFLTRSFRRQSIFVVMHNTPPDLTM
jgi:hypothetical protein